MTKLAMVFIAILVVIQVIKPLGWPGLRYRRDAWKLAVFGLIAMVLLITLTALIQPSAG